MNILYTLAALLMVIGLTFVIGSEQKHVRITRSTTSSRVNVFNLDITEQGRRFTEKLAVNKKENLVFFSVPSHNNVSRSDVLMDFNLKLMITRILDKKICHVRPLDAESTPGKIQNDLKYTLNQQANGKSPYHGITSYSTEWSLSKILKKKDLPSSVKKFCAGFQVYSLKKSGENGLVVRNDSSTRSKRGTNFQFCPNSYSAMPCSPDKWILNCKFVLATTCVYWVKCFLPIGQLSNDLKNCQFIHNWSAVMCCIPKCP